MRLPHHPHLALGLALATLGVLPATALAAPGNDLRRNAQHIAPPARVDGTTVGAGVELTDLPSCNEGPASTVWYSVTGTGRRMVTRLASPNTALDAVITVYRARRSQLEELDCDVSDEKGNASTDFPTVDGAQYLIRVARRGNSEDGPFTLSLRQASAPATGPGRPLPRRGVSRTLDRVLNTSDAWSVRLRGRRTYRLNLSSPKRACIRYGLYPPGTTDFDASTPLLWRDCRGYAVFTTDPGGGGRYTVRVLADRTFREPQPYHLEVARATRDDLAPGVFLRNHRRVRSKLNGRRVDVRDLYRFDVTFRSVLDLRLSSADVLERNFNLVLLNDTGRRLRCACGPGASEEITRRLKPGRYFVAVEAVGQSRGRYTLSRASRTITSTHTTFDNHRRDQVAPHRTVRVGVAVPPSAHGKAIVTLQRFDPIEGWRFMTRRSVRVRAGHATFRFRPPAVGRYRARADYLGARDFAPSGSGWATLLVAGPLRD